MSAFSRNEVLAKAAGFMQDAAEANGRAVPEKVTEDTPLFGGDGCLDSMGLVMFIADCEEWLAGQAGRPVTLMNEKAMSRFRNPFASLGSAVDFMLKRLGEE